MISKIDEWSAERNNLGSRTRASSSANEDQFHCFVSCLFSLSLLSAAASFPSSRSFAPIVQYRASQDHVRSLRPLLLYLVNVC